MMLIYQNYITKAVVAFPKYTVKKRNLNQKSGE